MSKVQNTDSSFYYIGIDTATTGSDYFVAVVLKEEGESYKLVYFYRKQTGTSEYHLYKVIELIDKYNPIRVSIEVTGGTGQVYLERLEITAPRINFQPIRTTRDSKATMIDRLKMAMEQGKLIYPKKIPLIAELLNFRRDGLKLAAAEGKHDDFVMSLAFALSVTPYEPSYNLLKS